MWATLRPQRALAQESHELAGSREIPGDDNAERINLEDHLQNSCRCLNSDLLKSRVEIGSDYGA